MKLKLEIHGHDAVADELKQIGERAHDAKPVLRVIQALMAESAREQFESEGSRGGLPWVPDKNATVARKAREGFKEDTEIRTGDLEKSLAQLGGGGNAIRRLSMASTTFGTRLFYARFQGHKRQLLRITTKDADLWAEKMVDWILSGNT